MQCNNKNKQYDPHFLRSYGTYNCKVPKKIRTVCIIGPVRIIGTLEYEYNGLQIVGSKMKCKFSRISKNVQRYVTKIAIKEFSL